LETLHPAYFAAVMATGIIAVGATLHAMRPLGFALFGLSVAFYVLLCVALIARIAIYPKAVLADIGSHSRGVGFFTIVAATAVMGLQFITHIGAVDIGSAFLVAASILLVVLIYGILTILTVTPNKPTIVAGLNGGWLVCVVATQSVARLITLVVQRGGFASASHELMFAALVLWLGGGALYLWIMTLIFFRYTFLPMSPTDLTPPYWINMGAVAISALAGLTLIENAHLSPIIADVLPFVKGFTLFFWSIGSWWIPMLLILGVWRHIACGVPLSYDPLYWGAVFPLGMYAVSTYHLTLVFDAPFLAPLSRIMLFIALAAWSATLLGMLDSLWRGITQRAVALSTGKAIAGADRAARGRGTNT
jgi:tellurite resistance protein TehA-like permease